MQRKADLDEVEMLAVLLSSVSFYGMHRNALIFSQNVISTDKNLMCQEKNKVKMKMK